MRTHLGIPTIDDAAATLRHGLEHDAHGRPWADRTSPLPFPLDLVGLLGGVALRP